MIDYVSAVREFYEKQRQPIGFDAGPLRAQVSNAERDLRWELIREEAEELRDALWADDRYLIADALADLLVVVFGTAVVYGMPIDEVFAEVHRSNMTKSAPTTRAPGAKYGEGGGKGLGYEPPMLAEIITRAQTRAFADDAERRRATRRSSG